MTALTNPQAQSLLDQRVQDIPGVRGVVALADDGLPLYWAGVTDKAEVDRLAALGSGASSLATGAAQSVGGKDAVRTIIEADNGSYVLVCRSGGHSLLLMTTTPGPDLRVIGYELTELARQLGPTLDTERRVEGGARA